MTPVTRRTLTALAAASTVIGFAAGCTADRDAAAPSSTASTAPRPTGPADASAYRDGDYEATGEYGGLPSHLDVAVTVEDGTITDVEVTPTATNETSLGYQQDFADAVPDVVIGKALADVSVGKLAGSSSCGDGFNDAITQIREQAAA